MQLRPSNRDSEGGDNRGDDGQNGDGEKRHGNLLPIGITLPE
jgi:hypothetical protein